MTNFDYDFFVIGGGSGGVRAGRLIAGLGKRVGIAEEYRWGGTCVIRGCVPKKLMVYASTFSEEFEAAEGFGWTVGDTSFDWKTLIANKDAEIARLEGLYQKGLDSNGADIIDSRAELRGPHEIYLKALDKTVTAEKILVAVGGTPTRDAGVEGSEFCITSDEVFHLEELPEEIVIAGGGYIAVEFAGIFAGLGSKVTLIYRGEEILRGFDGDLRSLLHEEMEARGISVICGEVFTKIEKQATGKLIAHTSGGNELSADQVMLAIGRGPATDCLGLESAGVETDARGFIKVDAYSKTSVDHIWAVGDVTNRVALTPVAIHESMCLIETEFKNNPTKPDHDLIATAVFSQPEIGTIGLGEEAAAERYTELEVYRAHFRPMKNTLSGATDKMLMKIIVDAKTDKVVGLHVMGHAAGEMAQSLGVAIKMGATKADFDRTMAVHPTAAEELVTMYSPSYRVVNGERV
ncbi:MAG: glutathione-disulfide reductase [Rhizobiaceae bacterium]|nr:glutathione-disulfide reductase [Rhizobiaceae bacterium]